MVPSLYANYNTAVWAVLASTLVLVLWYMSALQGIIRNDTLTLKATVTDPTTKLPVSLDGWKGYCTIKQQLNITSNVNDDASALAQVIIASISDPTGTGIVLFNFIPSVSNILPGNWEYDVQVISTIGQIYSSAADSIEIIADVTRANS